MEESPLRWRGSSPSARHATIERTLDAACKPHRRIPTSAVGRPGLEARCSAVWSVSNALLTVPLALLAGMVGVVSATAGTGIVASIYFVWLCRRAEQLPLIVPRTRWWLSAGIAASVTIAGELAVLSSGLDGFIGLAVTGIPPLVGLALLGAAEHRHSRSRKAQLERVTST